MGSLFPLFGLNMLFWVCIGLLRVLSEKNMPISVLRRSVERYCGAVVDDEGDVWRFDSASIVLVVICAAASLWVVFLLNNLSIGESFRLLAVEQSIEHASIWGMYAAGVGYISARIEKGRELYAALLGGVMFWSWWFVQSLLLTLFSIYDDVLIETHMEHMPSLLLLILASSIGGSVISLVINHRANLTSSPRTQPNVVAPILPHEVCSMTAAMNEESTIAKTIESLLTILPPENIYIGNDGSTDRTVEVVQRYGVNIFSKHPNGGKANMMQDLIEHFDLANTYRAVIVIDADSEIQDDYFDRALPLLSESGVAAVGVHAMSKWEDHTVPRRSMLYTAHRVRFYRVLQAAFRYGQSWKYFNAAPIIPGFASIYKSEVISSVPINAKGLVIEDFNMTFEVHHRKLGRVAYSPAVLGFSQDPVSFKDYWKQIKRWNLGFWQTVRRHGFFASALWFQLIPFLTEMVLFGLFTLCIPFLIVYLLLTPATSAPIFSFSSLSIAEFTLLGFFLTCFLLDYVVTVCVSIYERKPILLVYGLFFPFLRFVDTWAFLYTIPLAFTVKSDGRWVSPKRATAKA